MKKEDINQFLDRIDVAREFLNSSNLMEIQQQIRETCEFLKRFSSLDDIIKYASELEKSAYIIKEYLTVEDAARYLHLNKSAVYRLTSNHQITFYKPGGKNIFIRRADLEKWIGATPCLSSAELEHHVNSIAYKKRKSQINNK